MLQREEFLRDSIGFIYSTVSQYKSYWNRTPMRTERTNCHLPSSRYNEPPWPWPCCLCLLSFSLAIYKTMAPRTGGDPLVGEEKIDTNSEDYRGILEGHVDGSFSNMMPSVFYKALPGFNSKYTLKAVQTAWTNAKRLAGTKAAAARLKGFECSGLLAGGGLGTALLSNSSLLPFLGAQAAGKVVKTKPLVSSEKQPKKAKYEEEEVEQEEEAGNNNIEQVSSFWHPLVRKWQWTKANGHQMIVIKFCLTAGMLPGTTAGIDIHAVGAPCSIRADWPKEFYSLESVRKYYGDKALKDADIQHMLNAEEDHLKQLMMHADDTPCVTVVIPLEFHVIETRNPESNVVCIKGSGARMITIQLASTNVPIFAAKQVVEDAVFDS